MFDPTLNTRRLWLRFRSSEQTRAFVSALGIDPDILDQPPRSILVRIPEIVDLGGEVANIIKGLLDGCPTVAFTLPPFDVVAHFSDSPLLLLHLVA
jgi:hypothetical protein